MWDKQWAVPSACTYVDNHVKVTMGWVALSGLVG